MSDSQGPAAPASGSFDDDLPTFEELAADPEIAALLDFDPVPRQLQKANGWTAAMQRMFIAWLAHYGSAGNAAGELGKARSGIDKVYKTPGADSFRAAWDGAVALAERRLAERLASARSGAGALKAPSINHRRKAQPQDGPLPGQVVNELGECEDEESYLARAEEAKDSIGGKLIRIRRLYLQEIGACPGKRAAFEILTELPIDWEKAAKLEPQEFEPWLRTNQRQPDMILTAESGWSFGEWGYGPDRKAEARKAIDEYRAEEGLEPVDWEDDGRSNPPIAGLGEGDHGQGGGGAQETADEN